jgi:hypothetical protein
MVMCEGVNDYGEPRYCFCFMRQIRGCKDQKMKISKSTKKELLEAVDGLVC